MDEELATKEIERERYLRSKHKSWRIEIDWLELGACRNQLFWVSGTIQRKQYQKCYNKERYRTDMNDRAMHVLARIIKDCKRFSVVCSLTRANVMYLFQTKICQCCGRLLDYSAPRRYAATPSIDRVVPSLGYTELNTRMICWICNRRKNDSTLADLEQLCAYIKRNSG